MHTYVPANQLVGRTPDSEEEETQDEKEGDDANETARH